LSAGHTGGYFQYPTTGYFQPPISSQQRDLDSNNSFRCACCPGTKTYPPEKQTSYGRNPRFESVASKQGQDTTKSLRVCLGAVLHSASKQEQGASVTGVMGRRSSCGVRPQDACFLAEYVFVPGQKQTYRAIGGAERNFPKT